MAFWPLGFFGRFRTLSMRFKRRKRRQAQGLVAPPPPPARLFERQHPTCRQGAGIANPALTSWSGSATRPRQSRRASRSNPAACAAELFDVPDLPSWGRIFYGISSTTSPKGPLSSVTTLDDRRFPGRPERAGRNVDSRSTRADRIDVPLALQSAN